jgi:hypothetical protein
MKCIRELVEKYEDGRDRYKRVCGVNHGGRFIKRYGEMYFRLFGVSVDGLKRV